MNNIQHQNGLIFICLLSFTIQLQACQIKDNSMKGSVDSISKNINTYVIIDSLPNYNIEIPDYYDIEKAELFCEGFDHSMAYRTFIIKLVDVKSNNAIIHFKNEEYNKMQLPYAFCDTLANYLFRFYVKKEPIILSKRKTNIEAEETIRKLMVKFSYKNQVFKEEMDVWIYRGGYMIVYSPYFMDFCDWIRYLCDQYYYNYNNPNNAYW